MKLWQDLFCNASKSSADLEIPRQELEMVLARLFDMILPFGVVFGGMSLSFSVYRSVQNGWHNTLLLHLSMYLVAMVILFIRRHLPKLLMFIILIALIGIDTIQSLFVFGLAGSSIMNLAIIGMMTGIFFGIRVCLPVMLIGVTAVASLGAGICLGVVSTPSDITTHLTSPIHWIVQISCMIMYVIPLVVAVQGMKKRLMISLCELKLANCQMQEEIAAKAEIEKKLRDSESRFRSIFENTIVGIFQITPNERLLMANPSFAHIGGFDSSENMLAEISNFVEQLIALPEDREHFRSLQKAHGRIEGLEVHLKRKDHRIIRAIINGRTLHNTDGEVAGFEGTMEDVTQRKIAEIALQESEAQYRSVVENSIFGICIIQDGCIRYTNRQLCGILGYGEEELIRDKNLIDLIHIDDKTYVAGMIRRKSLGLSRHIERELKVIGKNGKIKVLRMSANAFIRDGRPATCVSILDITNEKVLEGQLLHAQKMEALGTLTGGIAHDFNNILTVLLGVGNILKMELDTADPRRIYADQIISASSKAANLTRSLLIFSRKQAISLQPINLNDQIRGTKKLLKRLITEDIELSTYLTRENSVVMADAVQIDQILFNLAVNARDAMKQGGKLVIQTEVANLDARFVHQHGFGIPGKYINLAVSDTGMGMSREIMAKIFDPFFTTKEQGKGTGLGLSTVYGIVKQHEGFITMYSELDKGTSCHIYLPAAETAATKEKDTPEIIRYGNETILIAEDDEYVSFLMKDVLGRFGYRIIHAVNGDEAVTQFHKHPEIDLVILDTIMPGRNGREVFNELKKSRSDLKAIFTSGYAKSILLEKGIQQDSSDFLSKPFSQQHLLNMVREVLDRQEAHI
jgi:PAS domain S-box-containing protein